MKKFINLFSVLFALFATVGIISSCSSDNDTPTPPSPSGFSKGTFYMYYGTTDDELDIASFKFKFTYRDENGNEKTEEDVVDKSAFTATLPYKEYISQVDGLKFYKRPVKINSLPGVVKCEASYVLKNGTEIAAEKINAAQAIVLSFQPDGSQNSFVGKISSTKGNGVEKDKIQGLLDSYMKTASRLYIIQKSGDILTQSISGSSEN